MSFASEYQNAKRGAFRFARELARKRHGMSLRRFKEKVSVFDTEDTLGPEWHSVALRGSGYCMIWQPIGEKNREECRRGMQFVYERGDRIFGVSIYE